MKKVLIKIYAGGAWEGHVAYSAIHPTDYNIQTSSSSIEEIITFCQKHNLLMDEDFTRLVKNTLSFSADKGFTIPLEYIDENSPISSASKFLKSNFPSYY